MSQQGILEALQDYYEFWRGLHITGAPETEAMVALRHEKLIEACNKYTAEHDGRFPTEAP